MARKSIEKDWDGKWPRYDPNRGYMLCEPCWNLRHWLPGHNSNGKKTAMINNCKHGGCGCGCTDPGPRKVKYTGEGQIEIPMGGGLQITAKS